VSGRYDDILDYELGAMMSVDFRYTRAGGKQIGTVFLIATLGEGMRAAIGDIKVGYLAMIEGWRG